jgi:glycerophosphoryl diester phosphodiesterase
MAEPLLARHEGRSAVLKWHRARRAASDPAFTTARILEGLRAGASVEIDINPLACGDFAVIHDATLDRETTGSGSVAAIDATAFGALRRRAEDGRETGEPALTLSALARALGDAAGSGALLQLDLKCGDADLTPAHAARLAESLAPMSADVILSGGDAAAVLRLTAAVPGLMQGFDPCHDDAVVDLARSGAFDAFAAKALAAAPDAAMIYLDLRLPLLAAGQGADLIAPFHAAGKRVDCYTLPATTPEIAAIARQLIALGADQITTDDAEGLAAALS